MESNNSILHCFTFGLSTLASHNLQRSSHTSIEQAIKANQSTKIDDQIFVHYTSLYQLSRRSRYLIQDGGTNSGPAIQMNPKHFSKALNKLEAIIKYFDSMHNLNFPSIAIDCVHYSQKSDTKHILKKQIVST